MGGSSRQSQIVCQALTTFVACDPWDGAYDQRAGQSRDLLGDLTRGARKPLPGAAPPVIDPVGRAKKHPCWGTFVVSHAGRVTAGFWRPLRQCGSMLKDPGLTRIRRWQATSSDNEEEPGA